MQLSELKYDVEKAIADLAIQDAYVKSLGEKIKAGEKIIKVYDESLNVWTEIKLIEFWQIQYDQYLAMSGYAGDMNGLLTNLQSALDEALPTIALPIDRVKAAAEAGKA